MNPESLRAMLIIPRHPSPEVHLPLEDRDLNSLSQPELVALLRQERAAQASKSAYFGTF